MMSFPNWDSKVLFVSFGIWIGRKNLYGSTSRASHNLESVIGETHFLQFSMSFMKLAVTSADSANVSCEIFFSFRKIFKF